MLDKSTKRYYNKTKITKMVFLKESEKTFCYNKGIKKCLNCSKKALDKSSAIRLKAKEVF